MAPFVRGPFSTQATSPPVWGQYDIRDFGVTFSETTDSNRAQILTTVVAARVSISKVSDPGTVLTTNTASSVTNNQHAFLLTLRGYLDAAMSGATENVLFAGQFFLTTATGGENSYDFEVYVSPKKGTTTAPDSTIPDGFYTKSQTSALFVPLEMPADSGRILTSPGGRKFRETINDDGTVHFDEI